MDDNAWSFEWRPADVEVILPERRRVFAVLERVAERYGVDVLDVLDESDDDDSQRCIRLDSPPARFVRALAHELQGASLDWKILWSGGLRELSAVLWTHDPRRYWVEPLDGRWVDVEEGIFAAYIEKMQSESMLCVKRAWCMIQTIVQGSPRRAAGDLVAMLRVIPAWPGDVVRRDYGYGCCDRRMDSKRRRCMWMGRLRRGMGRNRLWRRANIFRLDGTTWRRIAEEESVGFVSRVPILLYCEGEGLQIAVGVGDSDGPSHGFRWKDPVVVDFREDWRRRIEDTVKRYLC